MKPENDRAPSWARQLIQDIAEVKRIVSGHDDKFFALERKLSAHDRKFSSLDRKLSAQGWKLSAHDRKFSSLDRKLSAQGRKLSAHDRKFSSLDRKLSAQGRKLSSHDRKLSEVIGGLARLNEMVSENKNYTDKKFFEVHQRFLKLEGNVRAELSGVETRLRAEIHGAVDHLHKLFESHNNTSHQRINGTIQNHETRLVILEARK